MLAWSVVIGLNYDNYPDSKRKYQKKKKNI